MELAHRTSCVLFYFPLLIALGAGAKLSPGLKKICSFSGKISHPLYMTHYLAIWMFLNYCSTHKVNTTQLMFIIGIGTVLLVGLSWPVMVIYDIPVRKYLNSKRKIA
jgi:peptidoglycan/LPS O-acetylase OafA/YrhL